MPMRAASSSGISSLRRSYTRRRLNYIVVYIYNDC